MHLDLCHSCTQELLIILSKCQLYFVVLRSRHDGMEFFLKEHSYNYEPVVFSYTIYIFWSKFSAYSAEQILQIFGQKDFSKKLSTVNGFFFFNNENAPSERISFCNSTDLYDIVVKID